MAMDWRGRVAIENLRAYNDKGVRVIANKGGTRSGKTYSVMMLLIHVAYKSKTPVTIDIVSESFPHLKRGAIQDAEDILYGTGLLEDTDYTRNRSDHQILFPTGSYLRFFSAEDWGKVKGSRRDVLFINECNRIPWEVYRQLAVRTKYKIFLDWNPDSAFWYEHRGVATSPKTREIHSTYKDNRYLTEQQIAEIESNKGDANWWLVYGLGETGHPQGQIYTDWDVIEAIPTDARLVARGLDFGFTNDPTAIVDVYQLQGELYLRERCYLQGLTNDKIAERLRGLSGWTIADSAEMKSITEIRNFGIRYIEPAVKGAGSIMTGIDVVRRYKLHVTEDSNNIIYELENYRYKEDRITGEIMNEPIDKYNHALDAVRYVAINRLAERPTPQKPRAKFGRI